MRCQDGKLHHSESTLEVLAKFAQHASMSRPFDLRDCPGERFSDTLRAQVRFKLFKFREGTPEQSLDILPGLSEKIVVLYAVTRRRCV